MTRSLLVYPYLFRRFVGKAERKDFGEPGLERGQCIPLGRFSAYSPCLPYDMIPYPRCDEKI